MKQKLGVLAIVIIGFFSCQQAAESVDKEALRKEIRAELEQEMKGAANVQSIVSLPVEIEDAKLMRKAFRDEFGKDTRIPNYVFVDTAFINELKKDEKITGFNLYPIKYVKDTSMGGVKITKGTINFLFVIKRDGFAMNKLTKDDIYNYNEPCFPNTVPICSDDF